MAKGIEADNWLSAEEARELIFYFIRWGEHRKDYLRTLPDEMVEEELQNMNYDFADQISKLQKNPHCAVKWFENLLVGGTWEVEASPGMSVTHSILVNGVEISNNQVVEHAVIRQAHTADFLSACNARDEAIAKRSLDCFYTAISKGFSSIEAYFTLQVHIYNAKCTDSINILSEKRKNGGFISLDEKLTEWLPIMTGVNIEIGGSPAWEDYKFLRKLRNDVVIHPKPGAGITTIDELADGINRFRYGIGALMFLLHQAFGEKMQATIIRAMRYPTVRGVQKNEG